MMERSQVESAIAAFEATTGFTVVVHDLNRQWWAQMSPQRGHHHQVVCRAVKRSVHAHSCLALEIDDWRSQWQQWPDGRLHRCHAGLLEWVVPLAVNDVLMGVVFAGQRQGANDVTVDYMQRKSPAETVWRGARQQPPQVTADEAWRVLELLRQLAARLLKLRRADTQPPPVHADRWARCERYLYEHHARSELRLADLARHLNLSESRVAHLFQERGEGSFTVQVTAIRLRSAADYLRRTDLSITEVATTAGFGDSSHFHRVFRSAFGCTPRRYRSDAAT
jgi:AraC-like DNA-binding protein